ncbi:MAG TPA: S8 family serine peptidase, partial [Acidimicrobiia bacterium]|nr:S8 family serine peptidase [Acidimicrobiia bacterium]
MKPRRMVSILSLGLVVALCAACSGGDGSVFATTTATSATSSSPEVSTTGSTPTTTPDGEVAVGRIEVARTDPAAVIEIEGGLLQTDRLVVVLEPGSPAATADAVAASLGGTVIGALEYIDLYQISLPAGDEAAVRAAVETARTLPGVQLAYADVLVVFSEEYRGVRTSPLTDPVYEGERGGGYRAIGLERAWEYIRGSGIDPWGVKVGIVDTKLWRGNGEFDEASVTSLNPAIDETATPEAVQAWSGWQTQSLAPNGGHGTGVATVICGDGGDGGAVGVVTPVLGNRLECVHTSALDDDLPGYTLVAPDPNDLTQYTTAAGHTWSVRALQGLLGQVQAGAKVINMSFECHNCGTEMSAAYRRFFEQMARDHPDVVFVAAAGNAGDTAPDGSRNLPGGFPLPNVITVGNVYNDGTTVASSNQSSATFEVTIAAPGHQAVRGVGPDGTVIDNDAVLGTATQTVNGVQTEASIPAGGGGTSMAAPQVTGAIALMKALDPTLTAQEIKDILKASARPGLPATDGSDTSVPIDPGMGAGLLAVDEAVL